MHGFGARVYDPSASIGGALEGTPDEPNQPPPHAPAPLGGRRGHLQREAPLPRDVGVCLPGEADDGPAARAESRGTMLLNDLTRAELAEWAIEFIITERTVDGLDLCDQAAFERDLVSAITQDDGRIHIEMHAWWDLEAELLAAYAEAVQP